MSVTLSAAALAYFRDHAIDPEVAERCGVREDGHSLVFPCAEFERTRSLNGGGGPKVRQPAGTPLAAWWATRMRAGPLILVTEGESDALAAVSALVRSPLPADLRDLPVVAVPGTGYPVERLVDELIGAGTRSAYLALDADDAGRDYSERTAAALTEAGIRPVPVELPDGSDLAERLAAADDPGDWIANLLMDSDAAAPPLVRDEPADRDRLATSWAEVDLGPVLAGDAPRSQPTILARTDGECLLYSGKVNEGYGEPESGKTFFAKAACTEQIQAGEHVVYLDFEDAEETAIERMLALGVAPDDLKERFHYARPDEPLAGHAEEDLDGLLATGPTLIVVDGVNAALGLEGLPLEDNARVTAWTLPRRLTRGGAAVLLLDHVVKSREERGRYPIGAQAKLALVDRAAYRLDVIDPFGRGRDGLVKITVTKDRPGHVRGLAAENGRAAELHLHSRPDGSVDIRLDPPDGGNRGDFRPTRLMANISEAIARQPGMTKTAVREAVPGKHDAKDLALDLLIKEEFIKRAREGQALRHYPLRPYVEEARSA